MFRHSSLGVAQNRPSKFCCYGNCPSELCTQALVPGSCAVKVLVHRSRVVKVVVHWSCADKVIVLRSCGVQASVWHTPVSDTHNDQTPLLFPVFLNVLAKCFLLFSSPLLSPLFFSHPLSASLTNHAQRDPKHRTTTPRLQVVLF